MLKCVFIYVPKSQIKGLLLRAYLGYQIQGILGIAKSLLYTLGWRYLWKKPGLFNSK